MSEYLRAGLDFGISLDSFSFDDDDDAFRELRITYWLHSLTRTEQPLSPEKLFDAALRSGFRIVNNIRDYGRVEEGAAADLVVLTTTRWLMMSLTGYR